MGYFKMQHKQSGDHINTHNACLNDVLSESVALGYIAREQLLHLRCDPVNTGMR